ncbi:glycoside hydrolase superfamily [Zychaea mexicana]|uniref:glycoside hydrolase superfamily n=1 Tax=Zychaea mexicana TaxID=64656 RepID=UPI0022FE35A4|nr:glycoside hydrolase superfamily [Zychaea mexicana]KAI9494124.1 glycoside hydrolase superfamily [Zychaea mexicana]
MVLINGCLTSITLAIAAVLSEAIPVKQRFEARQEQDSSNGLTDAVTWDTYTLRVNGERVFLTSGEFHYYRLPSPDLWRDILQKFKALEFSGVSYYFNWGYHSPKKGVYDFTGIRDVQKALDLASEYGLHVIARAGPYINAEVDAGGFPGWLMNMSSVARKSTPENNANSKEWLNEIDKYLVPNQASHGGPIILNQLDNEYALNTDPHYMQFIKDTFHEDGIVVPLIHNDAGPRAGFVTGLGSADIYGWGIVSSYFSFAMHGDLLKKMLFCSKDRYPVGFDCSNPERWATAREAISWREFHEQTNDNQPMAVYEFQGGAFDPWGGVGYDSCRQMVNEQFAKVYYKNNLAQGTTIQNLYMTYGGTSWGGLAKPTVYTSYDYGAPISEPGLMTPKGYEIKLQGTFLHTVTPFLTTEHFDAETTNENILVDGLYDINTSTKFYIAQHLEVGSTDFDEFTIKMNTTLGEFNVPRSSKLVLNGRDAKILTSDYNFDSQHLAYTTSEIFTHQAMKSHDVILVYAYEGEDGEFAIKVRNDNKVHVDIEDSDSSVQTDIKDGILQLTYQHPNGTLPIYISGAGKKDLLVLVSGYSDATRWWAPTVGKDLQERVLIYGPYLIRGAEISKKTVSFTGDIDKTTEIQVVVPDNIKSFKWNGRDITLTKNAYGIWTGTLEFTEPEVEYTDLGKAKWKYSPGSPESDPDFDDSEWVTADHLTTNSITPHETWPILYADDYGFHTGCIWLRGTFNGTSEITGFDLTAISGDASAWIAWLNGEYLGGFDVGNQAFTNLNGTLIDAEGENVISLLLWTTGHEDDWDADDLFKTARGFTKAELLGLDNQTIWSIDWKIQGNLGGEDLADPVRGPYNEGGLYGERNGWHLPGFPDNDWEEASISESTNRTGVSWYRTTFNVNIPEGYDVPMSLRYIDDTKTRYRSIFFLNGWNMGRYANDLGPQTQYYLPKGILNTNGENTLAIAVVAIDEAAQVGQVILEPYKILESAIPSVALVDSPTYKDRQP